MSKEEKSKPNISSLGIPSALTMPKKFRGESPPIEKLKSREPREPKEAEKPLDSLFVIIELSGKLDSWAAREGGRAIDSLLRQVEESGKKRRLRKKEEQALHEKTEQLKTDLSTTTKLLHEMTARLLSSNTLQESFQETLGRPIYSLEQAREVAGDLLARFHDQYHELLGQKQEDRAREKQKEKKTKKLPKLTMGEKQAAKREAAWAMTGLGAPESGEDKDEWQERGHEWEKLIEKLVMLPGSHRQHANAFAKREGSGKHALALLESYDALQEEDENRQEERFSMLELAYTKADLDTLHAELDKAKKLITELEERAPKDVAPAVEEANKIPEKEAQETYQEMQELFRDNFFGLEAVEQTFTLADNTKFIELSPEQKQEAFKLLHEKLGEPDVKQFIEKVKSGEIKREDWLCVLRLPQWRDGSPITMKSLREKIALDMTAQNQGKLYYGDETEAWYAKAQDEAFYTTQQPGNRDKTQEEITQSHGQGVMHWQFNTVDTLEATKNKNHAEQETIRIEAAQAAGLLPDKTGRRIPVETMYDSALFRRVKAQDFLPGVYDWSDVRSSDGRLVGVGGCGVDGAFVYGYRPGSRDDFLRVSLSR